VPLAVGVYGLLETAPSPQTIYPKNSETSIERHTSRVHQTFSCQYITAQAHLLSLLDMRQSKSEILARQLQAAEKLSILAKLQ
jgi:hypothetical protein